jgi:hypothetical protein
MTRAKGAVHQRSMANVSIAMMPQHGRLSLITAMSPMPIIEQSFSNGGTACRCVRQPMMPSIGTPPSTTNRRCPALHHASRNAQATSYLAGIAAKRHS